MSVEEGIRLNVDGNGADLVSVSGFSTSSSTASMDLSYSAAAATTAASSSSSFASASGGSDGKDNATSDGTIALLLENLVNNAQEVNVWLLTLILALGNAADAIEINCIGFIMTEIPDMTTKDKEYLSAAVFLGMFFGGIICGFLSDSIGRKPCLLYSLGLNAIAGYASALTPNIPLLIVCRVIGGVGIGGSVPAVFSLGAEMFPSLVRGKFLSVVASFWMVGAIFTATAAWIMLGSDLEGNKILPSTGWRSFAAVCATPALVAFFLTYFFVSESPRFLLGKKQYTEAAAALEFISGVPVRPIDLMQKTHQSGGEHIDEDVAKGSLRQQQENKSWLVRFEQSTFAKLFSPSMIRNTLVLSVIWFSLCFGSYGISTWISELFMDIGVTNAYADAFIFALANLPGNIISICYVESFGRRRLLSYGMGISALAAFGFAIDTKHKETVVFFASLFNAFSTVGWNSLDCLSVESFPTNVRTTAMGVLAAAGRLGAITAQFVNGSLESNVPLLLGVTSTCMVLGGLSSWLLENDNTGTQLSDEATSSSHRNRGASQSSKVGYTSISSRETSTHSPLGGGGGGGGDPNL